MKLVVLLIRSTVGRDLSVWIKLLSCGSAGRMLLSWNLNTVKKLEELVGSFSIFVKMMEISSGFEWMFIEVYSLSSPYNWHLLWEELFDVRGLWLGP